MQIAELFENEGCQAVRLPEDCRFEGTEVLVKRIGSAVLLVPKDQVWEGFMEGISTFGNDFLLSGGDMDSSPPESVHEGLGAKSAK